ncbi:MFS transporter [Streptosporangium soli]|nr:MFS transporter [Streptosporangium sp. KLBMP 9127]
MTGGVPSKAGRREWIGLAVLVLPTLLLSIDMTALFLAVPQLSADLAPSGAQLLWITDIYGFLIAGFLITMGTLGDRIGRRRLLLIGGAAFAVASVAAAYSTSAEMLIAARALLGVAGATLMPSTLSLIRNMFHDRTQRTLAISVWMTGFSAGSVLGPLVGGVLIEQFWWGAVFLLGVPVMGLLLILGPLLLPEYRDPGAGRLDLLSALLSLAAVLAVIYGLKEIAAYGVTVPATLSTAAGIVLALVFVRRQRALPDPLLDLRLFAVRSFSASLGTLVLVVLVGPGVGFLTGQYLQLVLGLSPFEAGLWSLPPAVAIIVGFMLAPALARRIRPAYVAGGGLAVGAGGLALIALAGDLSGPAAVVIGQVVFFAGAAPLMVLGIDLIVGSAPPERSGSASALSETGQEFGGALGLAIFGSVATVVYRGRLVVPEGVPPAAAEAAQDTLGGAAAAAARLPEPLAGALLGPAREAFTSGMQVAAVVGAVVVALAAVLSTLLLRHLPAGHTAHPEPEKVTA